ncbi:MAG: hypothetical protein ACFWUC_05805 [Oscillospiraceae bacterium]|jgi:leucyl aminopeptidase (aminopeptidase T)
MINLDKMNDVIDSLEQVSNALKNIKSTDEYLEQISNDTKQELEKMENMLCTIESIKEETRMVNQHTEQKLLDIMTLLNEKLRTISDSITDSHNQYIKYVHNQFKNMELETDKINRKIDDLKEVISTNQNSLLSEFNATNAMIERAKDLIQQDAAENMKTIETRFNAFQKICEKRFYILMSTIIACAVIGVTIALIF